MLNQKGLIEFTLSSGVPQELDYWADIIEKTANELCNHPESKGIQFKIDENRKVLIIAPEYDDLFCLDHLRGIKIQFQT